jgi:hypothetical protein
MLLETQLELAMLMLLPLSGPTFVGLDLIQIDHATPADVFTASLNKSISIYLRTSLKPHRALAHRYYWD